MAFNQAQLDALDAALAQGVTEVQYRDRTVKYRTLEEMMRLRRIMEAQVTITAPTTRVYPETSKGL